MAPLTRIGNIVTAYSLFHEFSAGDWVIINGASPFQYNGLFQVSADPAPTTDTFSVINNAVAPDPDPGTPGVAVTAERMPASTSAGNVTRSSNTVTVTLQNHGLQTGDYVQVTGATPVDYNGPCRVTKLSADQFTYPLSGDLAPAAGDIKVQKLDRVTTVKTCGAPGEDSWFALKLDPNGTSVWSAGL